jgi:hypothetical protein
VKTLDSRDGLNKKFRTSGRFFEICAIIEGFADEKLLRQQAAKIS